MRVKGHALTVVSNDERAREEHAATGTCRCGWEESASSRRVVRDEYYFHLLRIQRLQDDDQEVTS